MAETKEAPARIRHGRLRPGELAEVAVLGDLSLVLETIGWFVPHLGGAFQALAVVPFSLLASRHRLRAAIVATVAAATVAFLIGGVGIVIQTGIAGALGASVGVAYRRRWRAVAAVGFTATMAGLPLVFLTLLVDWASPGFRHLTFAQLRIVWRDARRVLSGFGLPKATSAGNEAVSWVISHWYISVPAAELVLVAAVALACVRLRPFLDQVSRDAVEVFADSTVAQRTSNQIATRPPAPVPLRVRDVSYRYPRAATDALSHVSVAVSPGQLLALVGPNGSGKSTLIRMIIGRIEPTAGTLSRPGSAGLGESGGVAVVFQRPESQVLGVRVRDDVIWGIPPESRPEVGALLEQVGLAGFEERETSTLSGGELQRLAIAAALARRPRLLVSDEATAMIDRAGRRDVLELLGRLASSGMAVVHVTHRREEAEMADVILRMEDGRVVGSTADDANFDAFVVSKGARASQSAAGVALGLSPKPVLHTSVMGRSARRPPPEQRAAAPPSGAPRRLREAARLVSLRGAGYVYSAGTPWARRALEGIDLDISRGEGVVISGANGSGKSTLAWILAGLTGPTEGEALIDGAPILDQPNKVGLAFQHARLQLLRPTVLADVAIGSDDVQARRALREVGLDPDELGGRRIDDLSGGEQRRVALAGLLVRRPELVILDEPYAGLDDASRRGLVQVLRSLREKAGIAVAIVSHDLDEVEALADRLVTIENGRLVGERELGARL
ncbi:MAG: DUF2232 domain-containing protein [Acidimicrobiales bacterium]